MRATPVVQSLTEPLLSPLVSAISGVFGNGWNPISLFTSGQQGYAYDLNDLPTVFLDSAGTTAATVNGSVGLVLDKSKGLALGAELLSSGAIGVTGTATAATYNTSTGAGTVTRVDGSNQSFVTFTGLTSTAFYQVTIQNTGSNILSFRQGTFASTILGDINVGQTKTFISLATTSQLTVTMSPVAGSGSFVISTFKALAGNHAYQATSGSRPILRGTPVGDNLVTNGDFASGTGWTAGTGWAIGSGVATATASVSTLTSVLTATIAKVYRLTYTITRSAGSIVPSFGGVSGASRSAAGTYVEYLTASSTAALVFTGTTFSGTVDNVQVVDVSAGSVQAPYALQFDGVDDFLQTAAVNFSATDKMTVCHGVRKLSDAAQGIVVELSADTGSNNGSFRFTFPGGAGANTYAWLCKGTVASSTTASGYIAPITNVVSGIADIAGDSCLLRVNGAQVNQSTSDQGTGNFGNYALYFGRRAGASIPYNGLMFSSVCVGKTVSAIELASIERWVNIRTGAY